MENAIDKLVEVLGSVPRVAAALDLSPEHVRRMRRGEAEVTRPIEIVAYCLEIIPRRDWPPQLTATRPEKD